MAVEKEVVVGCGLMVAEKAWVATEATAATTGRSFILCSCRRFEGGLCSDLKTTRNEEKLRRRVVWGLRRKRKCQRLKLIYSRQSSYLTIGQRHGSFWRACECFRSE